MPDSKTPFVDAYEAQFRSVCAYCRRRVSADRVDDTVSRWRASRGVLVKIIQDGTYRVEEVLPVGRPLLETGTWTLDRTEFVWNSDDDSPACAGFVARYEITLGDDGLTRWTSIGFDPCLDRASVLAEGPLTPLS